MAEHSQGLLVPFILVPADGLDMANSVDVIDVVSAFAGWAETEAMLVPGEYPDEAKWVSAAWTYIGEVENGGHGQFAANTGLRPDLMNDIREALVRSGATELHAILQDFLHLMESSPAIRQQALATAGFEGTPAEMENFDRRLFGLDDDERYAPLGRWLRSLGKIRALPQQEWKAEQAKIIAANPRWLPRREIELRRREEAKARNAVITAGNALCTAAGLRLTEVTGSIEAESDHIVWALGTTGGPRYLRAGPERAELLDSRRRSLGLSCSFPVGVNDRVAVKHEPQGWLSSLLGLKRNLKPG